MLFSLLFLVFLFIFILWAGARTIEFIFIFQNTIPFTEWENHIDPLSVIKVWDKSEFSRTILMYIVMIFILFLIFVIVFRIRLLDLRPRLSKSKRSNYTSWQNHLERRRALYRIMWNDRGQIETGVIERWYDAFFKDLIKKHNAIFSEYNRPIYELWNEQKEFNIPRSDKIDALNVNKEAEEDDR